MNEFTPGSGGSVVLAQTNVWANGVLIATDDVNKTHFYLNDWLGTRRVQTDAKLFHSQEEFKNATDETRRQSGSQAVD